MVMADHYNNSNPEYVDMIKHWVLAMEMFMLVGYFQDGVILMIKSSHVLCSGLLILGI
jgi:hypothetical protein